MAAAGVGAMLRKTARPIPEAPNLVTHHHPQRVPFSSSQD
jgi:hypothetical protein